MGRCRKILSMQTGAMTNNARAIREKEEKSITTSRAGLRKPPAWLIDDTAKAEWRRVIKLLLNISTIGDLDTANIGGYCNAFSRYTHATEAMNDQPFITEINGKLIKNPLIDIELKYGAEMRAFAAKAGLTIDSRLKAAAIKTAKTEDEITQEFGVI